nr:hypothetical protein [Actinoplanes atraurantiacus]
MVIAGWAVPAQAAIDSNISFVGRWNKTNASAYVPYWAGAYLRIGFTGKTVKLKQRNTVDLWASIDGKAFTAFKGSGTINLTPAALAAGNHTLIVSYRQVAGSYTGDAVFQGLILDAGATTFKPPARGCPAAARPAATPGTSPATRPTASSSTWAPTTRATG